MVRFCQASLIALVIAALMAGCARGDSPASAQRSDGPQMSTPARPETTSANADVVYVRVVEETGGTWTFYVTVQHSDTGWEDYADGWDVVTLEGEVLQSDSDNGFTRRLLHPHVDEQPFTRSQSGIRVPEGATEVRVRAHDSVDGFGGREVVIDLTRESGPDYEVKRGPS